MSMTSVAVVLPPKLPKFAFGLVSLKDRPLRDKVTQDCNPLLLKISGTNRIGCSNDSMLRAINRRHIDAGDVRVICQSDAFGVQYGNKPSYL